MALPHQQSDLDEQELIERHVDLNFEPYGRERAEARLKRSGVSVWVIIAFLPVYDDDAAKVADHFGLTPEEMEAAFAYYRRNRRFVDALVSLNES